MGHAEPAVATRILRGIRETDDSAAARLLPIVYDQLKDLAAAYMQHERRDHTLQPTALVHEAFLRLIDRTNLSFRNRAHFLGVAARAMRQVLIDHARRHNAAKRGGDWERVSLDPALSPTGATASGLLALHEAMQKLEQTERRLSRVVELRYFGGLTIDETAAVLDVSHTTVENDWVLAKAWLSRELSRGAGP